MIDRKLLILDTHIWFWWAVADPRIPERILERIVTGQDTLAISAVSVYELTYLRERGRVEIDLPIDDWLNGATVEAGIGVLPADADIARTAAQLPLHHGDPMDRMIIATTLCHDAVVASIDTLFAQYQALSGRLIH